jgi:hypothetical protein
MGAQIDRPRSTADTTVAIRADRRCVWPSIRIRSGIFMSPTLKHNAVRAKSGGACRHAYFADTLIRVGVTSTRTPLRLRKKAMNASGSSVENTPLICIFRSAGVAISIGFAV